MPGHDAAAAGGDRSDRKTVAATHMPSAEELGDAVSAGDAKKTGELLRAGANPDAGFIMEHDLFGRGALEVTPLCCAAGAGNLDMTQLLLDHNADPNLRDSSGLGPLKLAASSGQTAMVELLIEGGADIDATHPASNRTALHFACLYNKPDCVAALVRNGCDATTKDSQGNTGKQLAEMKGHTAVLDRLRAVVAEQVRQGMASAAAGGDGSDRKTAAATRTPSAREFGDAMRCAVGRGPVATRYISAGDTKKVGELLCAGANPDAGFIDLATGQIVECTPLCYAAGGDSLEVPQLLLDHNADPNLRDSDGYSPLMLAVASGFVAMVELLIKRCADIDAVHPEHGVTALHVACMTNQPDCVTALVRNGCDATIKDGQGRGGPSMPRTGKERAEMQGHAGVLERLAALESEPFVGVVVKITGLVSAPEHNGERAAVRQYMPDRGRWEVELLCSGGKGIIRVKPANMELALVPPGIRVRVRGLGSAAQHNGKTAVVTRRIGATGRCQAKLEGDGEQAGKPLGLRPVNMELLPPAMPDSVPDAGDRPERKTVAATEPAAEGAATWSKEEQVLLEKGLKEFPSALKDERWHKISTKVSSRSPEECKKRYEQIVAMLKAGRTPSAEELGEALRAGNAKKVGELLRAGANPDAGFMTQDHSGKMGEFTPLCYMAGGDSLEVPQLLLDHNADPNLWDSSGLGPPLMLAAKQGFVAMVELLIKRGADIDAVHPEGGTALHFACLYNQPDCAAALVRNGCNASIKDEYGKTGKQVAELLGYTAVLDRLRVVAAQQLRQRMAEQRGDAESEPELELEPEPVSQPSPAAVSLPTPPDDIPTTAVTKMFELLTNLNLAHHFDRLMENEIDMTSLGASS